MAKLSNSQKDRIKEFLDKFLINRKKICEICKNNNWRLLESIVNIVPDIWESKTQYPCFLIMCETCGNTKFFNAIFTGVCPQEEESKEGIDKQGFEDKEIQKDIQVKKISFWKKIFGKGN